MGMRYLAGARRLLPLAILSILPVSVLGGDILSTTSYSICMSNGTVQVNALDVTYNKNTRVLTFDVSGSSTVVQNVSAEMTVSAYGKTVYTKTFDPCDAGMTEMCPVPAASFSSQGQQTIPEEYASQIPSIAFSIPDLDGTVKMTLIGDDGEDVACIQSAVGNGHTFTIPAISYVAAGVAAAALALSAVSALAAGGHPGASTSSPTFGEVIGWFQGMSMNGMLSVQYPQVYQSFTTNFGFSTGLVPWGSMQTAIDSFRVSTGGNLTGDSYDYLNNNATLVYSDGSNSSVTRRALDTFLLWARDGTSVDVDGTTASVGSDSSSNTTSTTTVSKEEHYVSGIEAYVEQLSIPQANTFMTLLLVWAIIVGAIVVLILLLKVILEAWSMFGNIPKSLESWRKRYWWRLAKVLTNLILLLYGVWTMYCIYQFTDGDSWAAKVLAGVTLGAFTAVLAAFTWRIYTKAQKYKKLEGDAGKLYEDKENWLRYNLFYENYKKSYWWMFLPVIIYMFARGAIIAGANGHGLIQTCGQMVVEALMLMFLLWTRPFQRKSGVWINIIIQTVRVISVVCILVFVEELGISQTTKTITGIVLIVVQGVLTGVLAILIAVNSLIACIRENPHRKQRKLNEKLNRDLDDLTPLDARNSLLMEPMSQKGGLDSKAPLVQAAPFSDHKGRYNPVPPRASSPTVASERSFGRPSRFERAEDGDRLMSSAASMGHRADRSVSRSPDRQPTLPDVGHAR
ncbi:hypothetical protein LTR36_008655 [Oleoguttula mirabilis]|uniref:ML-like domain-containing protein n=1 Tax=Oleoguttula mirabilis TaxID=1507867 RepID=A0AAV9JUY3_9PEZI|nr:hypothetical protein LTR36_008655 [Oleoguttula mirabilis]